MKDGQQAAQRTAEQPAPSGERGFDFSPWTELPSLPQLRPPRRGERVPGVPVWERLIAGLILIILIPLFVLIAVAIKIDSPHGPALYRQERVGLNRRRCAGDRRRGRAGSGRRRTRGFGKQFMVYKFRTMIPDAEKGSGPVWASCHDPRVTRVGRVLRNLRFDELPQLLNVLRGEMKLIGPRPERPHFVERLAEAVPEYPRRQMVPPGITGLAQVEREYDASVSDVRKKVQYDLFYVQNRSSLLNVKIILKTILVALLGKGAR